jgi:hypothetical protein
MELLELKSMKVLVSHASGRRYDEAKYREEAVIDITLNQFAVATIAVQERES